MANTRKQVVIVGGGEVGLCLSILFAQRGLIAQVVDPWAHKGYFARSGDQLSLVQHWFNSVTGLKIIDPRSKSGAIKPLTIKAVQRQLHAYAQNLGVEFIGGTFQKLLLDTQEMEILESDTNKIKKIPCYYAIDCSGTERVVINDINSQIQVDKEEEKKDERPFNIEKAPNNPRPKMLSLRVNLPPWRTLSEGNKPLTKAQFSRLHSMGWTHYSFPECYRGGGRNKVYVYMEAPEGLNTEQQQIDWANTIYSLSVQQSNVFTLSPASKKWREPERPTKANISYFSTHSRKVTPYYYAAKSMMVIHAGDATHNLTYETGMSAVYGFKRAAALVKSCTIDKGEIQQIDFDTYKSEVDSIIKDAESVLQRHYDVVFNKHQAGYDHWVKAALTSHQKAMSIIESLAGPEGDGAKEKMKMILSQLKDALEFLPADEVQKENKAKIYQGLQECAKKSVGFAVSISKKNPDLAEEYSNLALSIYAEYFPTSCVKEKFILYYSLITMLAEKKPDAALSYADQASEIASRLDDPAAREKHQQQIMHNKVKILLNQAGKECDQESKKVDVSKVEVWLSRAEELVKRLKTDDPKTFGGTQGISFSKRITELTQKMAEIKLGLQPKPDIPKQ